MVNKMCSIYKKKKKEVKEKKKKKVVGRVPSLIALDSPGPPALCPLDLFALAL